MKPAIKMSVNHIAYLRNTVMEYAWGSYTAIADLMGQASPSQQPQAELWLGAHPKAPSWVKTEGGWESLADLIQAYPAEILGEKTVDRFGAQLPFLLKVLAAARPLSVQAHPAQAAAQTGFDREEGLGIPLNAPHRNYKDPHHKPECICALTPFWGLCGFRNRDACASLLRRLCPLSMGALLDRLQTSGRDGMAHWFQSVMNLHPDQKARIVEEAVDRAKAHRHEAPVWEWIVRLHQSYPSDIGVIFPAVLNLVCLRPGEALYLRPGELHAYLEGLGIEIMANSDNVLRGGLTAKHVDVPELIRVLSFDSKTIEILTPKKHESGEAIYATPAGAFQLAVIHLKAGEAYTARRERSVEILLCTTGRHRVMELNGRNPLVLSKGSSLLVPAAAAGYVIEGQGVVYKAGVPL